MIDEYWVECCNDQDFLDFLQELLDYDMVEKCTPAYGITKMIIDGRYNELSSTQWNVFVNHVAKENYVEECKRCHNSIPWCEMVAALDNGGYCGYCNHLIEKDD
ncbi:hypothetical protein [Clostridium ganghwense]|uniref:Uncharacterized protein n=1 Tax=Clostridium ganghwense TaxID=312089 RepID=A0ABT4CXN7_9CLOT|nr:hypothetical protein [Clostridium ganghwense]MCY6372796.1 hypothetical protein [Clostridium ganghwense]